MNIYLVITQTNENKNHFFSSADKIPGAYDLQSSLSKYKRLYNAFAFPTYKKAKETADFWNECYKKNGTFLLDFKEDLENF